MRRSKIQRQARRIAEAEIQRQLDEIELDLIEAGEIEPSDAELANKSESNVAAARRMLGLDEVPAEVRSQQGQEYLDHGKGLTSRIASGEFDWDHWEDALPRTTGTLRNQRRKGWGRWDVRDDDDGFLNWPRSNDFDRVTDNLLIGGQITSEAMFQRLLDEGVTHIVNMQAEWDDENLVKGRIPVKWMPIGDDLKPKGRKVWGPVVDWVREAMIDNPDAVVYAHCAAGINRGPSAGYAIMRAKGYESDEALRMIREARPITKHGVAYAEDIDNTLFHLELVSRPPMTTPKVVAA